MKKVVYVRASKTDGVFSAGLTDTDSGECERLVLSVRRYPPLCDVRVGDAVEEELYSLMKQSDEEYRARKKALSLLSFSDNNERTLKRKLVSHGFSRDVAQAVSEEMIALGYINEKRQLERLIVSDAARLYGPSRILARLLAKGYSPSDIRTVMRGLVDSGEIDFEALSQQLLDKKYPDGCSDEERRALLYKHGYKSNK